MTVLRDRTWRMTAQQSSPPPRHEEPTSIGEVVDLVKTYAQQETVGPLKGAGKWLAMGAAGRRPASASACRCSCSASCGCVQTEWDRVGPWLAVMARRTSSRSSSASASLRPRRDPHQQGHAQQGAEVMAKRPEPRPDDADHPRRPRAQASAGIQDGVKKQVDDRKSTLMTDRRRRRRLVVRADRLPARPAQRQEEDHVRRDPEGVTWRDDVARARLDGLGAGRPQRACARASSATAGSGRSSARRSSPAAACKKADGQRAAARCARRADASRARPLDPARRAARATSPAVGEGPAAQPAARGRRDGAADRP